jgi:hypothetical protein
MGTALPEEVCFAVMVNVPAMAAVPKQLTPNNATAVNLELRLF